MVSSRQNNPRKLSNKDLLSELIACFKHNLEEESFGERMLFPTSFNILMNPEDFHEREDFLPFVVRETVNAFYRIIREKSTRFSNYAPPAKTWNFQFSPCESFSPDNRTELVIERGKPHIIARLFSASYIPQTRSETNTKVSYKPKNSVSYSTFNLNPDVFLNMDILAAGVFSIPFDRKLSVLTEQPERIENKTYAELSYPDNGKIIRYSMTDKEIIISGNKETRRETWILILNSEYIKNSHVIIKYDSTLNRFTLAAFGPVKVNEKTVPESKGGDVDWYPLPKTANILIGNFIPVEFVSKKG